MQVSGQGGGGGLFTAQEMKEEKGGIIQSECVNEVEVERDHATRHGRRGKDSERGDGV